MQGVTLILLAGLNISGHPDEVLLTQYADSARVPPIIMWAVAAVESGHTANNRARSVRGAVGRMQLMGIWNRAFTRECGPKPITDYVTNVCKGAFLLRRCYNLWGTWDKALLCYTANNPRLWAQPHILTYRKAVQEEIGRITLGADFRCRQIER